VVCDETAKNCTYFPPPKANEEPTTGPFDDVDVPVVVQLTPDDVPVVVEMTPGDDPSPIATETPPSVEATGAASIEQPAQPTEIAATAAPNEPTATSGADAAVLEIVVRRCASGYDPYDPQARADRDCVETDDGATFRLFGKGLDLTGSAGDAGDGSVEFTGLVPGSYNLNQIAAPGIALSFVGGCESDLRDLDDFPFFPFAMAGPEGAFGLRIRAGETLKCAWYQVPEAGEATVAVTLRWCENSTVNSATCQPYDGGLDLTLRPAEGGEAVTVTTGEDGAASFSVPADTYTLEQTDGRTWCFADSTAFDADGNLVIAEGATVSVAIYNCGERP
jgi:hypothetical protein